MGVDVRIDDFDMAGQFGHLRTLFASYFEPGNKLLTSEYIEWLYGRNPFGRARMVVASEGSTWVGFMAMIPANLIKHSGSLKVYYVVNVLVHPDHHGKNIFGRMIVAAKDLVAKEGAALMGHPNEMAIKSWRRAEMRFQPPLLPSLVLPWRSSDAQAVRIDRSNQLESCCARVKAQAELSKYWSLDISGDYVSWRYLKHPVNRYRLSRVDVNGAPVGLVVSRRMKFGIHLVLDYFFIDGHERTILSACPMVSVAFQAREPSAALKLPKVALPLKKQMPFFFTHYGSDVNGADLGQIGLSLSDF